MKVAIAIIIQKLLLLVSSQIVLQFIKSLSFLLLKIPLQSIIDAKVHIS